MNIECMRNEIDEIDDKLVELFKERMEVSKQIANYKSENNIPVYSGSREREILSKVCAAAGGDIEIYTKILYSLIFDLSRSYQLKILTKETELSHKIYDAIETTPKVFPTKAIVACQGIEGSYSQMACDKSFTLPSIMYFNRFEGVFVAVEKGLCQYGILPIENSSYGSVNEVYDLMSRYNFFIVRSIKLRVNNTLLAKSGCKISEINEIYSHEQAIGQCSEFLKTLKGVKINVCENTAIAASLIAKSDNPYAAAISSKNCAEIYGLNILSEKIQNSDNNYTRFICISKNLEIYPGSSKISLIFSIPHKPGALYTLISKFSSMGLNITKLESRPMPGKDFEFMFYFDMDASVYNDDVIRLLSDLNNTPDYFTFLGSYSEI